jgi:hypothetical protein
VHVRGRLTASYPGRNLKLTCEFLLDYEDEEEERTGRSEAGEEPLPPKSQFPIPPGGVAKSHGATAGLTSFAMRFFLGCSI